MSSTQFPNAYWVLKEKVMWHSGKHSPVPTFVERAVIKSLSIYMGDWLNFIFNYNFGFLMILEIKQLR